MSHAHRRSLPVKESYPSLPGPIVQPRRTQAMRSLPLIFLPERSRETKSVIASATIVFRGNAGTMGIRQAAGESHRAKTWGALRS